jgi:glutathione S-transferase
VLLSHAPRTGTGPTHVLLEKLGAPYELLLLDLETGEHRQPPHLAVNLLGKVPAIRRRGQIVTEHVAIFPHPADTFPEAGLAPGLDDPLRVRSLRWLVLYVAGFEPPVTDRSMQRDPPPWHVSTVTTSTSCSLRSSSIWGRVHSSPATAYPPPPFSAVARSAGRPCSA